MWGCREGRGFWGLMRRLRRVVVLLGRDEDALRGRLCRGG